MVMEKQRIYIIALLSLFVFLKTENVLADKLNNTPFWSSKYLTAAGEKKLYQYTNPVHFRFSYQPCFRPPLIFHIAGNSKGSFMLTATKLSGDGGYEPGVVESLSRKKVTNEQVAELKNLLKLNKFYELSSDYMSAGLDGACEILEVYDNGKYHVVPRCNFGDLNGILEWFLEISDFGIFLKKIESNVLNILNSDTFEIIDRKKKRRRVTLYGIDAPEGDQPFGGDSMRILKKNIFRKKITAQVYSISSDGKLAAVVFADGKNINEMMIKSGHAWVWNAFCIQWFCDDWEKYEKEARTQHNGLWNNPGQIPPWIWR